MIRAILRSITMLGGLLIFSISIAGVTLAASPPGDHLNITEVFVDFDAETIHIMGEDLDFGRALDVTLGDFGSLNVTTETPTLIVVDFPAVGLPDGDYLLTVSRGNGQSQNDEYDLTIGAVGPEGPEGPEGPPGSGPADCPEGYVAPNSHYCIEENERTTLITWYSANTTCTITEDARLCTIGEWIAACENGDINNNDASRYEWVDSGTNVGQLTTVGYSNCRRIVGQNGTFEQAQLRCCVDR
jgi:hypothetical protein